MKEQKAAVTTYWVDADKFIPRGEYEETELDKYKQTVDFLITGLGNRWEIKFNHPVNLEESRSIRKSEYVPNLYFVTDKALEKLKKRYTYTTDF